MAKQSKKVARKRRKQHQKAKNVCFVIMPFGGWGDDYYQAIYVPAIASAGLEPHRADDLFRPSTITNDIWAYTKKAKVLLADLTGKNPNVFYELGLAHALAKPAILVTETLEDVPFDLRALRVIQYDKNASDWGRILREKVESSLKEVIASPAEAVLPAFLDVKSAGAKPSVSAEKKDVIEIKQELDLLRRELRTRDVDSSERFDRRTDIGPSQARRLIREWVRSEVPDYVIMERLRRLGPPPSWIQTQISEFRQFLARHRRPAKQARRARSVESRGRKK